MTIASDVIYKLNKILTQTPMSFFPELEELKKKCWKKDPKLSNQPWKRKTKLQESDFLNSDYTTKIQ